MSKNVLVIGGGSGIGRQIITDLEKEGINIWAASRSIENADLPSSVKKQKFDATADEQLDLPEELNGLVYCPGTINLKPLKQIRPDDIRAALEVDLMGAFKVISQSIEALKKGQGSVVVFSTVAVQTGLPYHVAVSAAKGALEGMVRSLAAEFAPSVRFNAIAPSLTDTPLAEALLNNDKKKQSNADRHPMKSIGRPSDMSAMAVFLLSDRARWITGQVLKVDGGMSSLRSI